MRRTPPVTAFGTIPAAAYGTNAASGADRRLAVIAGLSVGISVVVVIVRALGLMPSAIATAIVLAGVVIALRVLMVFTARTASSETRARVLTTVSTIGIAVSAVTIVASLPHLTKSGGTGKLFGDLTAHLWTIALLIVAAARVRTFGWRVLVGTGFAGFLAVPAIARFVGTPVVDHYGTSSLFATAVYVPITEEFLKALPLALLVFFAARRAASRPSALDLCLLGAVTGAGFALYENALYGRGGAAWSADTPFSLLMPAQRSAALGDTSYIAAGHLVYTALIGLGIGVTVLYRRRWRWAWAAGPVAVVVVLAEHICGNTLPLVDARGHEPLVEQILNPLTLGGRLSSVLLVVGIGLVARLEWRSAGRSEPRTWFRLRPYEAARRAAALAVAQQPRSPLGVFR